GELENLGDFDGFCGQSSRIETRPKTLDEVVKEVGNDSLCVKTDVSNLSRIKNIAELWRRGSVVSSWLLDLTALALAENQELSKYSGYVADSGEGRWTIEAALEQAVPAEVLTSALYTRFRSRQEHTFAEKVLSAMRQKFGGHLEPKTKKVGEEMMMSGKTRRTGKERMKP
ncbi:MAG: hypothetical protein M3T96_03795, partial [Acidobacteriota bacterium]|nr:hypothetical protein [Acidobacteriota bacterium]